MWDVDMVCEAIAAQFGLATAEVEITELRALPSAWSANSNQRLFIVDEREVGRCLLVANDDGNLFAMTPDHIEDLMREAEWQAEQMRELLIVLGRFRRVC